RPPLHRRDGDEALGALRVGELVEERGRDRERLDALLLQVGEERLGVGSLLEARLPEHELERHLPLEGLADHLDALDEELPLALAAATLEERLHEVDARVLAR